MKKGMKVILALICLSALFLTSTISVFAEETPAEPKLQKVYIYLYNFENDKTIEIPVETIEKLNSIKENIKDTYIVEYMTSESDLKTAFSSTSAVKIMTGLLAIERLSDRLDEEVVITEDMVKGIPGGSRNLKADDVKIIRDLFSDALSGRSNHAANVLAYLASGGNVDDFIALMNQKAQELGMLDTNYVNPYGTYDRNFRTTTLDTATVAKEAYKNEIFLSFTSNVLNIGYTEGSTYVTTRKDSTDKGNEFSYLCVVMRAPDDASVKEIADGLFGWVFDAYENKPIVDTSKMVREVAVTLSNTVDYVTLMPKESIELYLPSEFDPYSEYTYSYNVPESLEAPVLEGQVAGSLTVFDKEGGILYTVELVTKNSVERNEFLYVLEQIKEFTKSRFFIASVICAVLLSIAYIFGTAIYRARAPKKRRRYRR